MNAERARTVSCVTQRLGLELPMAALFDAPAVAGTARFMDGAVKDGVRA